jgi:hypothetical protein
MGASCGGVELEPTYSITLRMPTAPSQSKKCTAGCQSICVVENDRLIYIQYHPSLACGFHEAKTFEPPNTRRLFQGTLHPKFRCAVEENKVSRVEALGCFSFRNRFLRDI